MGIQDWKKTIFKFFSFTFLNPAVNVLNCLIYFVTFYVFGHENKIMENFLSNCSYSFERKSSIIRSFFASKKHSLFQSFISSVLIGYISACFQRTEYHSQFRKPETCIKVLISFLEYKRFSLLLLLWLLLQQKFLTFDIRMNVSLLCFLVKVYSTLMQLVNQQIYKSTARQLIKGSQIEAFVLTVCAHFQPDYTLQHKISFIELFY